MVVDNTLKHHKYSRACGVRISNSTYIVNDPDFLPNDELINFVHCPPKWVDPKEIGLAALGILIVQRPGTDIWDAFDWMGAGDYKMIDMLVELKNIGLSRKVDNIVNNKAISKLDYRSLYHIVHPHAFIDNFGDMTNRLGVHECPHSNVLHEEDPSLEMCLSFHWEMEPGWDGKGDRIFDQEFSRHRPEGEPAYTSEKIAYRDIGFTPQYSPGIVMTLPAESMMFEIINDPMSNGAQDTEALLSSLGTNMPFMIVEE